MPTIEDIVILEDKMYILGEQCKGCSFCIEFCPKHVLVVSNEFNAKGYHPPKVANPDACIGCDMCETICPEFAIFTLKKKAKPALEEIGDEDEEQQAGVNADHECS